MIVWRTLASAVKILFSHRYTGTLEPKQTRGIGVVWCSIPVRRDTRRRRIHNPDLWLERPPGDGYEAGQKHIVDVHESFTDLPPTIYGIIERVFL